MGAAARVPAGRGAADVAPAGFCGAGAPVAGRAAGLGGLGGVVVAAAAECGSVAMAKRARAADAANVANRGARREMADKSGILRSDAARTGRTGPPFERAARGSARQYSDCPAGRPPGTKAYASGRRPFRAGREDLRFRDSRKRLRRAFGAVPPALGGRRLLGPWACGKVNG